MKHNTHPRQDIIDFIKYTTKYKGKLWSVWFFNHKKDCYRTYRTLKAKLKRNNLIRKYETHMRKKTIWMKKISSGDKTK